MRALFDDADGGADADVGVDGGDGGGVGADAAVRGGVAGDVAAVHADPAPGEAHPVGHGSALEVAAFGDGVAGVGVGVVDVALGVVDGAVEVGGFAGLEFFEDGVVSGGVG